MSWLLDTDVLSQPARRHGDAIDAMQGRIHGFNVSVAPQGVMV